MNKRKKNKLQIIVGITFILSFLTVSPNCYAEQKWKDIELSGQFQITPALQLWTTWQRGNGEVFYSLGKQRANSSSGDIEFYVNKRNYKPLQLDFAITATHCVDLGINTPEPNTVSIPSHFDSGDSVQKFPVVVGHTYLLKCSGVPILMDIKDLSIKILKPPRFGGNGYSTKCYLKSKYVVLSTPPTRTHTNLSIPIKEPSSGTGSFSKQAAPLTRWAVIIGISDYRDPRIPSLRYAAADARAFNAWAVSPTHGQYAPSRVKLLVNSEATGQGIKEALFVWLKQALEEDMVIIYFAGHGSPDSPDTPNNLFLLPYDVQYDNITTTGFPMWDIETALKRFIKANKVVVIADSCHSGGVGHSFDIARRANRGIRINPINKGIQNLSHVADGICIISASSDKQFSQESQKWGGGHGVFTHFLLRGLKGKADYNSDSSVTLGELTSYLSEQVRRETKNAQNPTVAGRYDPALTIGK